ncbi:MAG: TIGR00730 family Rossman fold protein [Clostridiaceae bacterium]|nr:TIGR00730 family Rossman fold protein [Clostridiaceae bacterium]
MPELIKRICVFCGSSYGKNVEYREKAKELGSVIAEYGIELIYGASNVGLMGEIARSVLKNKGRVIGIIPKKIYDMVEHIELTGLHIVEGMHERKAMMYEMSDAFIALPGGIGTIEELTEAFTWQQLGYHSKPVGLINVNGYFDKFIGFLDHMTSEGFLKEEHRNRLIIDDDPVQIIRKMMTYNAKYIDKYIN